MEKEIEEQLNELKNRIWNTNQSIEFLFNTLKLCGSTLGVKNYYNFDDFCILPRSHKGLHKNSQGYCWGFEEE